MPLTSTRLGPDWPRQVKTPGSYDWERSAAKWLRELVPARYASYPAFVRHPVLLARHAQIQVEHEIRVARTALQTARADLPRLGLHEGAIEHTIKLYAAELMQLQHIARSVRAVTQALGESAADRPGPAAPFPALTGPARGPREGPRG
ncbi:hypothetical protein, partial [Streptomyces althioticus]|uniref:hypothetical protein n=1 Tax=Streptomyces althioticus TaxID=83380 RepID=UPI003F54203E